MPTVWFSLKKSLHCKSERSEVHDPKSRRQLSTILTRKGGRSGCSRSIANLKDVIHGSKRHLERPPSNCSPRSIGSSEFLNPITHEVILSNSRCELKITSLGGFHEGIGSGNINNGGGGSTFVDTLRPGTPGPGGQSTVHYFNPSFRTSSTPPRKSPFLASADNTEGSGKGSAFPGSGGIRQSNRVSFDTVAENSHGSSAITCHKCGEHFTKWEAAEAHHLSKHAGKKSLLNKTLILGKYYLKIEMFFSSFRTFLLLVFKYLLFSVFLILLGLNV